MFELRQTDEGILVSVRAQPGARRNAAVGIYAGRLKIAVTQAAEKGRANLAIERVLAKSLKLKKSQVRLNGGLTSPHKTFLVAGLSIDELQRRIAAVLESDSTN